MRRFSYTPVSYAVELYCGYKSVCKRRRVSPASTTGLIDGIQQFFRVSLNSKPDTFAPYGLPYLTTCTPRSREARSRVSFPKNETPTLVMLMKARSIRIYCVASLRNDERVEYQITRKGGSCHYLTICCRTVDVLKINSPIVNEPSEL